MALSTVSRNTLVLFGTLLSLIALNSCAEKIYLQEALKLNTDNNTSEQDDIRVESYYSGDALDYIIFELDVFNDSQEPVNINYKDISLDVFPLHETPFSISPIHKDDLIRELQQRHREIKSEKKAYNIVSGIGIGLGLLSIGTGSNYPVLNGIAYASESAAIMVEDNRAYQLMTGSLEEQMDYIDNWVLESDTIAPGSDNSWDLLFPRRLIDAPAMIVVKLAKREFRQDFDLIIRKEKLR